VALNVEPISNPMSAARQRVTATARAALEALEDVAIDSRVHERRPGLERARDVGDDGQLVELGLDKVDGVLGHVAVLRDNDSHRFSDVPNNLSGQQRLEHRPQAWRSRPEPHRNPDVRRKIFVSDDRVHSRKAKGPADVESPHAGTRVRASINRGVHHTWQLDIGDKRCSAGEKPFVFLSKHRSTDVPCALDDLRASHVFHETLSIADVGATRRHDSLPREALPSDELASARLAAEFAVSINGLSP
jgi:hypothetical protein